MILRVLTFNLKGGGRSPWVFDGAARPDGAPSFAQLAEAVLALPFDVAALQEAVRTWVGNDCCRTIQSACRAVGVRTQYGRATPWLIPFASVGNLSLFREGGWRVTGVERHKLRPRSDWLWLGLPRLVWPICQREAQSARLEGEGVVLAFVNVHLNDRVAHRTKEIERLLRVIDGLRAGADHVVVAGDFNDHPHEGAARRMLEAGFADAMEGSADWTFGARDNELVREGDEREVRLDYVFFTPGNQRGGRTRLELLAPGRVVLDRRVATRCDDGTAADRYLSDHVGVYAEFRVHCGA